MLSPEISSYTTKATAADWGIKLEIEAAMDAEAGIATTGVQEETSSRANREQTERRVQLVPTRMPVLELKIWTESYELKNLL